MTGPEGNRPVGEVLETAAGVLLVWQVHLGLLPDAQHVLSLLKPLSIREEDTKRDARIVYVEDMCDKWGVRLGLLFSSGHSRPSLGAGRVKSQGGPRGEGRGGENLEKAPLLQLGWQSAGLLDYG